MCKQSQWSLCIVCYFVNHLPLSADIYLSFQDIGSYSLRVSKWECKSCPEADNSYFLFLFFFWRESEKKCLLGPGLGISYRSVYSTWTFFLYFSKPQLATFYWQMWACFALFNCLTINYSTRGTIHICTLVKLFFWHRFIAKPDAEI